MVRPDARRRRRAVAPALTVVVVATVAILAGVWTARVVAPSTPEKPPARVVRVGPGHVAVPADWQPDRPHGAGFAGLDAERAIAFTPRQDPSRRVLAVFAPTIEPSLIPRELRSALRVRATAPAATRIAGWPAWIYRDMPAGFRGHSADVTVLATTAGVLAIACTAETQSVRAAGCASQVESVTVPGATTLVPSRSLALELALPAVIDRLNRARRRHRARLRSADSGSAKAREALHLAWDHRAAARSLRVAAGPAAAPLIRDLTAAADAYDALGRAVQAGAPHEFAAARASVRSADAELARDVAAVPLAAAATRAARPPAPRPPADAPWFAVALVILLAAAAGAAAGNSDELARLWRSMLKATRPVPPV